MFVITPEIMRQLLSAATRTAIQSNWQVQSVLSDTQITVSLVNPAAAVPWVSASTAPYYVAALIEFVTGTLGGITPNADGQGSPTGRVSVPIASIASALNDGETPTTTITFKDALPALPAPGDRFVIFYPQFNAVAITIGEITGPVNVQQEGGSVWEIDKVGSITDNVTVLPGAGAQFTILQANGTTFEIDKVGSITENVGTLIQNLTGSPGNIQPGQGSNDTLTTFAQTLSADGTSTLLGSGTYLTIQGMVHASAGASSSGTIQLTVDGVVHWQYDIGASSIVDEQFTISLSARGAVVSGGVDLVLSITAGTVSVTASGSGTVPNGAVAPSRVGSVV